MNRYLLKICLLMAIVARRLGLCPVLAVSQVRTQLPYATEVIFSPLQQPIKLWAMRLQF